MTALFNRSDSSNVFLFFYLPIIRRIQIKTLRLATSYITYLNRVLEGDQDPSSGFRAELVPSSRKINAERRAKLEAQVIFIESHQNKWHYARI